MRQRGRGKKRTGQSTERKGHCLRLNEEGTRDAGNSLAKVRRLGSGGEQVWLVSYHLVIPGTHFNLYEPVILSLKWGQYLSVPAT